MAKDLLVQVGLADRADSAISSYSRGMRQRLGIARALVNNPAVVFLDEPTLGLDPAGQAQVLNLVRDIARRGTTVVLSTHLARGGAGVLTCGDPRPRTSAGFGQCR